MKKLISLLSAVALFATLLTTVAFADANNTYYIVESKTGDLLTLHYYLKTNQTLSSATGSFDLSDAVSKGVTYSSKTKGADAATFNYNTTKKQGVWSIANTDGVTGTLDIGYIVIDLSSATADFTIPLVSGKPVAMKDLDKTDVTSSFTDTATNYAVSVGGGDPVVAEKDTTTGVVAFDYTNATEVASSVLSGQKIKLFSETFTSVTSDTRFKITHNGTYKVFGSTLGEYLGISGGSLSGSLAVAVLFPEGDNTNFDIEKIN